MAKFENGWSDWDDFMAAVVASPNGLRVEVDRLMEVRGYNDGVYIAKRYTSSKVELINPRTGDTEIYLDKDYTYMRGGYNDYDIRVRKAVPEMIPVNPRCVNEACPITATIRRKFGGGVVVDMKSKTEGTMIKDGVETKVRLNGPMIEFVL